MNSQQENREVGDLCAALRHYGKTSAGPKGKVLLQEAAAQIERLDSALRIRIWNEARGRGVTQDDALALVKEAMTSLNPHSGPS